MKPFASIRDWWRRLGYIRHRSCDGIILGVRPWSTWFMVVIDRDPKGDFAERKVAK